MTQEQKAKAYDEALERARALHKECLDTDNPIQTRRYEEIFPQLAESADERMCKRAIAILKQQRDYWSYDGPIDKFPPATPRKDLVDAIDVALSCLEKQKEEKQKENPKSADSILSDCISDAKCEDRWHKVSDSLPDNGRLVLANDCLGNTLLARYDGEGNWEVSVYDNEDYYCRNTITKWCEIPSEKQKEPHFTKRNALFDKCVENCDLEIMKKVSDEIDAMLEKEQKPAEWSDGDEGMINCIIATLCEESHGGREKNDLMVSWLDKLHKSLRPQRYNP